MMKSSAIRSCLRRALIGLLILGVATPPIRAQEAAPILPPSQLDQLLAPIALYPDPLVAQILMASTYPLEVVDAARWLKDPANAGLGGDQLAAALQQQGWDGSVKSLVPFPQVVGMMDYRLDWTQNLGNAFLAQQGDVMDSVQRLRHRAQSARHLSSSPQEVVSSQGQSIIIEPADSRMLYVPAYDPAIVYGYWPYPGQPPVFFPPWPGTVLVGGFAFGVGMSVLAPFWGWGGPDWGHRNIHVDAARYTTINHDHPSIAGGVWQHDSNHRQAVPYRGATVRARFDAARMSAPRAALDVRGYDRGAAAPPIVDRGAAAPPIVPAARAAATTPRPQPQRQAAVRPAAPRAPTSAFEGVERGRAIHVDAARGQASRQVAAPPRAQPQPHQQSQPQQQSQPHQAGPAERRH